MDFFNAMKPEEPCMTENGAIGYRTTNNLLVDLNFKVPQLRSANIDDMNEFIDYHKLVEEKNLLIWLFFLRDIREGLGERDAFRKICIGLISNGNKYIKQCLKFIPMYGRCDDLVYLLGYNNNIDKEICHIIHDVLVNDLKSDHPSLMAKWLPSINGGKKAKKLALKLYRAMQAYEEFNIFESLADYRKKISALRKKIDIVESKMAANKWGEIDYDAVPSKANLKYDKAFINHDRERRMAWMDGLRTGESKVNASTLYMYDIVLKCVHDYVYKEYNEDLIEAMWKRLPQYEMPSNYMMIRDGSGSMTSPINNNSNVSALNVADSITIYCSERCTGAFHNKFITFSSTPRLVDLNGCDTLIKKILKMGKYSDYTNTNIEATMRLILDTAINNKCAQEDLPNLIIVSDMEFDYCMKMPNANLWKAIEKDFNDAGYKLPSITFWNVNSRSSTIPMKENEYGVTLVSGFSPHILKMVMERVSPWEALKSVLESDRYKPIREEIGAVL